VADGWGWAVRGERGAREMARMGHERGEERGREGEKLGPDPAQPRGGRRDFPFFFFYFFSISFS
jgi:hypothetical protein